MAFLLFLCIRTTHVTGVLDEPPPPTAMGKAHREVMYFIETKAFIQPLFWFISDWGRGWYFLCRFNLAVLNAIKPEITK
jgi:hypothetical protein